MIKRVVDICFFYLKNQVPIRLIEHLGICRLGGKVCSRYAGDFTFSSAQSVVPEADITNANGRLACQFSKPRIHGQQDTFGGKKKIDLNTLGKSGIGDIDYMIQVFVGRYQHSKSVFRAICIFYLIDHHQQITLSYSKILSIRAAQSTRSS